MYKEVIFDVETQKLFNQIDRNDPGLLKLSIVSAYSRKLNQNLNEISGQMYSFWEQELDKLWELFQSADRIIGFNSIHFDVPVLQPYTTIPLHKFTHFDILEHLKNAFGKRISLNSIAKDTLDNQKTDIGTNAVIYWQKGDSESLSKLQSYCEADVILTRDIYDYGLKNKQLKFTDKWNTPRTIDIDFSYPKKETDIAQTSLF